MVADFFKPLRDFPNETIDWFANWAMGIGLFIGLLLAPTW
jgi:hypothetical protein